MTFISSINTVPRILRSKNNIKALTIPLNGIEVGIPLNIFSNIYTNLHYGYDITTMKSILIQFLFGYYAYGSDRYKDALEYQQQPYKSRKEDLYNTIISNKNMYRLTLGITFISIMYMLLNGEDTVYNIPFIPLLYTAEYYKDLKKHISILKPVYISFMWMTASVILPCVLHDHDYSIIKYPFDYVPCMITLFAASNMADNKDIEEDKINNIETIPVKFGKNTSNLISFVALVMASIMIIENNNFIERPIVNSLVELQNFVFMGMLYNDTFV